MLTFARLRRHFFRNNVAAVVLVSLSFGLLAWAGIILTREEGRIAIVWLPNAVLVAVLLRTDFRRGIIYIPPAFAANLSANLIVGDTLLHASTLALVNQIEIITIWLTMRRIGLSRPDMQSLNDLLKFGIIGGLIAPSLSGLLAATYLASDFSGEFLLVWIKWAMTDGLGMLLLAPAVLAISDAIRSERSSDNSEEARGSPKRYWEWVIIQGLVLLAAVVLFGVMSFAMFFLVAPLILLSTFRLGGWGTAVSTILVSTVVAVCVSLKLGPFYSVDISLTSKLIVMQLFLLSCFVVGFPVAAILSKKDLIRQELAAHQKLSNSMLQNMREVIFRTNARGEWEFLNPAWETLTGLTVSECLGRPIGQLIAGDKISQLRERYAGIANGNIKQTNFESSFERNDGERIHVEISIAALRNTDGSFEGTVGNIRDITERKAMEVNLISARRHAEIAADAKTRFLANMSHEIRTPMNGVLGFTQLLLDSELSDEQRGQTTMILDSGEAMMRLLNNILDLSKVEAGQIKTTREPIDIRHIIKSCISLMAPTADQKGLSLDCEIADDVPQEIIGDGHHIRQILLNLLGNAVKFTERGHVKLTASSTQKIDEAAILNITVEDSGLGISPDRLTAIFDPFEQAESSTTQRFGGSGLGLTISRQLAAIMEGDISVESTEGEGTKFCLQFPAKFETLSQPSKDQDMDIELLGKPMSARATGEEAPAMLGRLLLVEDHDVNQMLITAMTRRLGYETSLAVDGADAVKKVDAAITDGKLYDLVLMDVQMPVMDGYEATRMIRTSGITPEQLPIIAITANAYTEDIESCLASGMQGHVAKPVMIDKLKSTLAQWVNPQSPSGYASLEAPEVTLSIDELNRKYRRRKEEVVQCLAGIVRRADYSEAEINEAADHLHKLAGTAAMFGEEDLGIKAKLIENGLAQWKVDERPRNMKIAVCDFMKAA